MFLHWNRRFGDYSDFFEEDSCDGREGIRLRTGKNRKYLKEYKRLKDRIYGYIQIPMNYMTGIVDSATFQRLRRIIQTSYSPLYSSAVHNRFVHSLGVYHLGAIAAQSLCGEIKLLKDNFAEYGQREKL